MTQIAAVQMASGPAVAANLLEAAKQVQAAAKAGAAAVVLPENFAIMGMQQIDMVAAREPFGAGPIQDFLAQQARKRGVWLIAGSVPIDCGSSERVRQLFSRRNGWQRSMEFSPKVP